MTNLHCRLAISKRTALKMYWDAGFDSEALLLLADASLSALPKEGGYFYADDVSRSITLDSQARLSNTQGQPSGASAPGC
jgi:hypothetical protein